MNRTILITGATSGFGEACARKFAAAGDHLILTGRRDRPTLEELADRVNPARRPTAPIVLAPHLRRPRPRRRRLAAIASIPPGMA